MKTMNLCPCCSTQLLRHARHNGVYWFCSHCWQEMPDLTSMISSRHQRVRQLERLIDINTSIPRQKLESVEYAGANVKNAEGETSLGDRQKNNLHTQELSSSPAV